MTSNKDTHRIRTIIALGAIIAGLVSFAHWLINQPRVLSRALYSLNLKNSWKIAVEDFSWRILDSDIRIGNLNIENPERQKQISASNIHILYKPLSFLRGKLAIKGLDVEKINLNFPRAPKTGPEKKRKKWDIAKLVILKNLELKNAGIGDVSIGFGESNRIEGNNLNIFLSPSFFTDTEFKIGAENLTLSKSGNKSLSINKFQIDTSTNLSRWRAQFPFVNALKGKLSVNKIAVSGIEAESLDAKLNLTDGRLALSDLKLIAGQSELKGSLDADASSEKYSLGIDILKPIHLPYIARSMETMDMAGSVSGKIMLNGHGFAPENTSGQGHIEITHRFDASPNAPVSVSSAVSWNGGTINVQDADVTAGKDRLSASAAINIPKKIFKLEANGKQFPLEHIFDKFRNPHLKKIFGPTDFTGTVEGWGKKFIAKVRGETFGGGWLPISAERIESELEATYDYLKLKGIIFSGQRQSGKSDLYIKFGPKTGALPRTKIIDLDASIVDHPLEQSLGTFKLSGTGTGHIRLTGPSTSFKGETEAKIVSGAWHGIEFEHAVSKLAITRHNLVFSDMSLKLPRLVPPSITGTITGDIGEGILKFRGNPIRGLSIDAAYRYRDSHWQLGSITWNDPQNPDIKLAASGWIVSGGPMEIKLAGTADLGALSTVIPHLMRSGKGAVDINIWLKGTVADPKPTGRIIFHQNSVSPRGLRLPLEDVNGALEFAGQRISFENVTAKSDDSEFALKGHLDHRNLNPTFADLSLSGKSMRFRSEDGGLRLEFEGALSLSGTFPNPELKGDITVMDGKYSKDFTIIDALSGKKPILKKAQKKEIISNFNPRLDLKLKNSGDLAIRNNIGDIWLNMNVDVKGTRREPIVSGAIDTVEGKIHYLGLEFDITKGFIEFRRRYEVPYLEVHAEKEINIYNTSLVLFGPTDNLSLDLSATSPTGALEKRDVVSLILFGSTEEERAAARSSFVSSTAGQAVGGIVGQPIKKIAHLDIFRLEAAEVGSSSISRIYLGKQLSDRFSINFSTDVSTENAVQTVIGEYLITDNLLIKGSRSSDSNYRVSGALRFRLR